MRMGKMIEDGVEIAVIIDALKGIKRFRAFEDRYGRDLLQILKYISDYSDAGDVDALLEDIYDFADANRIDLTF